MCQLRLIFKVDLPICVKKGAFFVQGKGNEGEILSEIISAYAGYSAGHRIEHYTSRLSRKREVFPYFLPVYGVIGGNKRENLGNFHYIQRE